MRGELRRSAPPLPQKGALSVKLIYLRSYVSGYRGLLEEAQAYSFFQFPRQGRLTRLISYDKATFPSLRRFVGGMGKFMPRRFFLETPVMMESITISELDALFARVGEDYG